MNMGTGIDFESHKHQLVDVKIGDFGLFSWFVDSDTNTSINFLQLLFVAVFLHNHSLNTYHTHTHTHTHSPMILLSLVTPRKSAYTVACRIATSLKNSKQLKN